MAINSDIRGRLLPATVTVFVSWWVGLTLYDLVDAPVWLLGNLPALVGQGARSLGVWAIGLATGAALTVFWMVYARNNILESLGESRLRDLKSSIGPVPAFVPPPAQSEAFPDIASLGKSGKAVLEWMAAIRQAHPAHYAFISAVIRAFAKEPDLPATHIPGGHGGATLLQHSILTGEVALGLSRHWEYQGLKDPKGNTILGLRNPHYVFDKSDPCIGIIAIAHDIGKMECYIREGDKITGSRHAHDIVGANMLARMPEIWDLPNADRKAILAAVAHYHHPMMLPLGPDGRAADDRTIALMELLIRADIIAGKVESGELYDWDPNVKADDPQVEQKPKIKTEYTPEALWAAFKSLASLPGMVNGNEGFNAQAIGQKCDGLVFFKESNLRQALMVQMGLSGTHRYGDGRYKITEDLMAILQDKGLLHRHHAGAEYSYKRAIFRVAFSNSKTGKELAQWPSVVVVIPGPELTELACLADHPSNAQIVRPMYGEQSAKNKGESGQPAPDSGAAQSDVDEFDQTLAPAPEDAQPLMADPGDAPANGEAGDLDDLLALVDGELSTQAAGGDGTDPEPETPAWDPAAEEAAKGSDEKRVEYNDAIRQIGSRKFKKLDRRKIGVAVDMLAEASRAAMDEAYQQMMGNAGMDAHPDLAREVARLVEAAQRGEITMAQTPKGVLVALEDVRRYSSEIDWTLEADRQEAGGGLFEVIRRDKDGSVWLRLEALNRKESK